MIEMIAYTLCVVVFILAFAFVIKWFDGNFGK